MPMGLTIQLTNTVKGFTFTGPCSKWLSALTPLTTTSNTVTSGPEFEHSHSAVELGNRPENLTYQSSGGIICVGSEIRSTIGSNHRATHGGELLKDDLRHHQIPSESSGVLHEYHPNPVALDPVDQCSQSGTAIEILCP